MNDYIRMIRQSIISSNLIILWKCGATAAKSNHSDKTGVISALQFEREREGGRKKNISGSLLLFVSLKGSGTLLKDNNENMLKTTEADIESNRNLRHRSGRWCYT